MVDLQKTLYYDDFVDYYHRAHKLQQMNLLEIPRSLTGDELQDSVTIYDTVNRHMAGFAKVPEDITGKRRRKDLSRLKKADLSIEEFHFLFWFHRYSGSGASFQRRQLSDGRLNPDEHGYMNSIVGDLSKLESIKDMRKFIVDYEGVMCTSVGNQGPSLKNPYPSKYRLSIQYYFDVWAEKFIKDYLDFVSKKRRGIKEAVDYALDWHSANGMKRWNFVITALVMDTAEYYPELVDPHSDVYHGANCIRAFNFMFKDLKRSQHDQALRHLCNELENPEAMSMEDVCCDFVRYVNNYIPKTYPMTYQRNKLRVES